jgi:hypothetical protein
MIGCSVPSAKEPEIRCAICARRVTLELSNTDEAGHAVHEACYVRKTVGHRMPTPELTTTPRSWFSALIDWAQLAFPAASPR